MFQLFLKYFTTQKKWLLPNNCTICCPAVLPKLRTLVPIEMGHWLQTFCGQVYFLEIYGALGWCYFLVVNPLKSTGPIIACHLFVQVSQAYKLCFLTMSFLHIYTWKILSCLTYDGYSADVYELVTLRSCYSQWIVQFA